MDSCGQEEAVLKRRCINNLKTSLRRPTEECRYSQSQLHTSLIDPVESEGMIQGTIPLI